MTRDEIMELANGTAGFHWMDEAHIQRFASVLIAAEREACAKVCEDDVRTWSHPGSITRAECAAAIRARSEK